MILTSNGNLHDHRLVSNILTFDPDYIVKLWISYFDDSTLLPPPFNILPTPNTIIKYVNFFMSETGSSSTSKLYNNQVDLVKQKTIKLLETSLIQIVKSLQ